MYYEIEGQLNMKTLIFDDDVLTVGEQQYPYAEIESLEITSAPLFAAYGILTLRTGGKSISIPFARSKKARLESALREFEKLRERDETAAEPGRDPYEDLKKLKELLEMDIITKEEFDAKKKQLLGL